MNELISYEAVYRTALATPSLLTRISDARDTSPRAAANGKLGLQ